MTQRSKRILTIVGISLGAALILGFGIVMYYRSTRDEDDGDENPHAPKGARSAPQPKVGTAGLYSKQEIRNMQAWLMSTGVNENNTIITQAISSTGGVDGVIGPGFWKAYDEAVKQGYIKNLEELFEVTNT